MTETIGILSTLFSHDIRISLTFLLWELMACLDCPNSALWWAIGCFGMKSVISLYLGAMRPLSQLLMLHVHAISDLALDAAFWIVWEFLASICIFCTEFSSLSSWAMACHQGLVSLVHSLHPVCNQLWLCLLQHLLCLFYCRTLGLYSGSVFLVNKLSSTLSLS